MSRYGSKDDTMPEAVRPIRVLRLIARLNVGGPARHAVILDEGLRRRGFDTLLVFGSIGPDEASLEELAHERGLPTTYIPELGRRIRAWGDARAFVAILGLLRRWKPDVVHTHTAKAGTLGRLAVLAYNVTVRRPERCATLHTFHGHVFTSYFGRIGSMLVRLVERALARITDRIVTISERQREDITTRFRIAPKSKVVVVPLGLDLGALLAMHGRSAASREAFGLGPGDFVVGYVGRLVPIKDLATLLRGTAMAADRLSSLRLLVAGDGDARPSLEALARQLDLDRRIRFLGWQRDLPSLYSTMDLFALTSLNEGTPVSMIEAMAAGVPVVATDVGGVPDVVEHGITGQLVPPRDPQALSDAILQAARQPGPTAAMAARAKAAVAERFDASRLVQDIDRLYRRTLLEVRGEKAVRSPGLDRTSLR
jgi:glycosyltransferase involved in cell wall biosynthesis